MSVSKDHALCCQFVHRGSLDLATLRIQALDIAVAKIVREDVNDVGSLRLWVLGIELPRRACQRKSDDQHQPDCISLLIQCSIRLFVGWALRSGERSFG